MAYCTQADLENRLSPQILASLCSDISGAESANAAIVTAMISKAQTLIDATIKDAYDVPFTSVPDLVTSIAIDLACFYSLQRRFSMMQISADWLKVYDDALENLGKIANLQLALDVAGVATAVASAEADIVAPDLKADFENPDSHWSFF